MEWNLHAEHPVVGFSQRLGMLVPGFEPGSSE